MRNDDSSLVGAMSTVLALAIFLSFAEGLVVGTMYPLFQQSGPMLFLTFYVLFLALFDGLVMGFVSLLVFFVLGGWEKRLKLGVATALSVFVLFCLRWGLALASAQVDLSDRRSLAVVGLALTLSVAIGLLAGLIDFRHGKMTRWISVALLVCLPAEGLLYWSRKVDFEFPAPLAPESSLSRRALSSPPNIVLITIDTLRADHLGLYGYERSTSPHIDALASRGVTFERAISQRSSTAPSLATLLTGTYPPTHRLENNRDQLHDSNLSLPEILKKAGYRTSAVVDNPNVAPIFNFDQGFDRYRYPENLFSIFEAEADEAVAINQMAMEELSSLEERPFFLWVHYIDPHAPYFTREPFSSRYVEDALAKSIEGVWAPGHLAFGGAEAAGAQNDLGYAIAQYDAEIALNDLRVGQLIEQIEALPLSSNTLIILTSDHGESLGEHGVYFRHGEDLHDPVAHIPLILVHPDIAAGLRVEDVVGLVDLTPTILELVGLPADTLMQGESFVPLLDGREGRTRPYEFTIAGYRPGYQSVAVRTSTHRLVLDVDTRWLLIDSLLEQVARLWLPKRVFNPYYFRRNELSLFDLRSDPGELRDVSLDEPQVTAALEAVLWEWLVATYFAGAERSDVKVDIEPEVEDALRALGYVH